MSRMPLEQKIKINAFAKENQNLNFDVFSAIRHVLEIEIGRQTLRRLESKSIENLRLGSKCRIKFKF